MYVSQDAVTEQFIIHLGDHEDGSDSDCSDNDSVTNDDYMGLRFYTPN